jgi:hypothetical protein
MLAGWKMAPALAAGNTFVWKPSEHSSASALAMAPLFAEAGLPPGVVNIVTGFGGEIGETLVAHPDVAKVCFTGGDATGAAVYQTAARGMKPVTMELGGKSANIVFADAALDNAVKGVVSGIFAATGQTCVAGSRALIHESIHDEFVERFLKLARTARMGNPLEETTQVGPITTRPQYEKVLGYIDIANQQGATCVLGGGPASDLGPEIRPEAQQFADLVLPDLRLGFASADQHKMAPVQPRRPDGFGEPPAVPRGRLDHRQQVGWFPIGPLAAGRDPSGKISHQPTELLALPIRGIGPPQAEHDHHPTGPDREDVLPQSTDPTAARGRVDQQVTRTDGGQRDVEPRVALTGREPVDDGLRPDRQYPGALIIVVITGRRTDQDHHGCRDIGELIGEHRTDEAVDAVLLRPPPSGFAVSAGNIPDRQCCTDPVPHATQNSPCSWAEPAGERHRERC